MTNRTSGLSIPMPERRMTNQARRRRGEERTEGNGGTDHMNLTLEPFLMHLTTSRSHQTGMVAARFDIYSTSGGRSSGRVRSSMTHCCAAVESKPLRHPSATNSKQCLFSTRTTIEVRQRTILSYRTADRTDAECTGRDR